MKKPNNAKVDYNRIATEFSSTRHYVWPEMKEFAGYAQSGWKILDLGCGNGRLLDSLAKKKINYLGIDNSEKLIEIARAKHPKNKFKVMGMEKLKLSDSSYDAVFAIASLHHIPAKELRRKSLSEANRTLKENGYLFITVWNLWQPKYRKYIWKNLSNMVFKKSKTHCGDTFIPWKDSDRNVLTERYYFAYTIHSLERDLKSAGFKIIEIKKSKWNIYAICKKQT